MPCKMPTRFQVCRPLAGWGGKPQLTLAHHCKLRMAFIFWVGKKIFEYFMTHENYSNVSTHK